MADHFSALKRVRQTIKRTARNRMDKTTLRKSLRRLREVLTAGNKEAAQEVFKATVAVIDRSIQKGAIHRNTAARYKSRLAARLKAMQ